MSTSNASTSVTRDERPRIRVRGTAHFGRWIDDLIIALPGLGRNKDDHTVTLTRAEKDRLLAGHQINKTSSPAPGGLRKGHRHRVRIKKRRC